MSPDNPASVVLREDTLFEELVALLRSQERPEEDIERVRKAFEYARAMHEGQKRKNDENYITHPVSVAIILANIPVDTPTVMAALLHDTIEDTPATPEDLCKHFGEDVCKLVEGVTKLGKLEFSSKEDHQAENFRKMFLAMADDIRIIMLKLGDRLHNMRTLEHMKPEKQVKIAAETLEIFAPLANRMGMGKIRAELEDLSLQYLEPEKYRIIVEQIEHTKDEREETIRLVIEKIQSQLASMGIEAKIYGRVKNYYSIYKKMQTRQKSVEDVYDISAVRVLVNSEKECYEVLGVIHHAFRPIPGRFKDYIAMAKSNLYQSLHTTVIGPYGRPLEVQIRTQEMHRIAEFGIAAHWKYKEGGSSDLVRQTAEDQKLAWLKQMVEMKEETDNAREYVDSVKLDLFRDEVFVFTPKGRVVVLPTGSTPVDFAYRIHTEVGNTCTGATVNGKIVTLDYRFKNGDIAEIITSKKSTPKLDWIGFVQTQQAKSRIRQWYKKHYREEHAEQGRRMLDDEFGRTAADELVKSGKLVEVAREMSFLTVEDMLVALGYGEIHISRITNRIKKPETEDPAAVAQQFEKQLSRKRESGKETIQGLQGMLYQIAKCCMPIPGEPIVGVVTRTRGVMVHREDCINLAQANPERKMAIGWEGSAAQKMTAPTHTVKLDIHVIDRVGVLKDILARIADSNTNISGTKVRLHADQTASVEVSVDIQNLPHLERIKQSILQVSDVLSVKRHRGR